MTDAKVAEFTARYMSMHEEDLAQLSSKRETLTEEAQMALNIVLAERNIDLAALQETDKKDAENLLRKIQDTKILKEKRQAKYTKIFFWVSIPFIIIGIFNNPELSYVAFISSLTQGFLLGAIAILIVAIRRTITKKRKQ